MFETGLSTFFCAVADGSGGLGLRTSGDEAPDDEYDQRTADGTQPGRQREERIHLSAEDHAAEPAAEHGTDDTEDERGEEAAALLAGQDRLGDGSGDESEDQICDETHVVHVPSETVDRQGCTVLLPLYNRDPPRASSPVDSL